MFNPPISSGANAFIIIAIVLIAAVAAVMAVDVYKNIFGKENPSDKE